MKIQNNKTSFLMPSILTIIVLLATITTVIYAAFAANKSATASVSFRSGIQITVNGIDLSGGKYYWKYANSPTSAYTTGSASAPILDYLEMAPITITVTSGASCYVRCFACVGTDIPSSTLAIGSFKSALTAEENTTAANIASLQTNETAFAFSNASQTQKFASTYQVTSNNTSYTMVNNIVVMNATGATEIQYTAVQNKHFYAFLCVYASTDNTHWDTFTISTTL